MISGTSYDGIDCSIGEFNVDGDAVSLKPLYTETFKYPVETYEMIDASMPPSMIELQRVCELDTKIGQAFAGAAQKAIRASGATPELIVSHGQTMYHWVSPAGAALGTLQLGDPSIISEATGISVLSHPRSRDVAAGGQGAPFASLVDHMLLNGTGKKAAALNLGGISNITIVSPNAQTIAYDVGPANALIDAAIRIHTKGLSHFDEGGAFAATGSVNAEMLSELLSDPYYSLTYPKSTGKELFNHTYLLPILKKYSHLSMPDIVATLTELTAVTISNELNKFGVDSVYVSGGGIHNKTMMQLLRDKSGSIEFLPYEKLGLSSDGKEAFIFALIGFLSMHNQPGNIPSSTGAQGPRILGDLTPGKMGFPIPYKVSKPMTALNILPL